MGPTADRLGLSNNQLTTITAVIANHAGGELDDLSLSNSTARRHRPSGRSYLHPQADPPSASVPRHPLAQEEEAGEDDLLHPLWLHGVLVQIILPILCRQQWPQPLPAPPLHHWTKRISSTPDLPLRTAVQTKLHREEKRQAYYAEQTAALSSTPQEFQQVKAAETQCLWLEPSQRLLWESSSFGYHIQRPHHQGWGVVPGTGPCCWGSPEEVQAGEEIWSEECVLNLF